jgi:hypothetical protein
MIFDCNSFGQKINGELGAGIIRDVNSPVQSVSVWSSSVHGPGPDQEPDRSVLLDHGLDRGLIKKICKTFFIFKKKFFSFQQVKFKFL